MQYLIHLVVFDREHVILNADETALASVRHSGRGMASTHRRSRAAPKSRPRDPVDRALEDSKPELDDDDCVESRVDDECDHDDVPCFRCRR